MIIARARSRDWAKPRSTTSLSSLSFCMVATSVPFPACYLYPVGESRNNLRRKIIWVKAGLIRPGNRRSPRSGITVDRTGRDGIYLLRKACLRKSVRGSLLLTMQIRSACPFCETTRSITGNRRLQSLHLYTSSFLSAILHNMKCL